MRLPAQCEAAVAANKHRLGLIAFTSPPYSLSGCHEWSARANLLMVAKHTLATMHGLQLSRDHLCRVGLNGCEQISLCCTIPTFVHCPLLFAHVCLPTDSCFHTLMPADP